MSLIVFYHTSLPCIVFLLLDLEIPAKDTMEELEKISDVNSSDDLRLRHFHDGSSHEQMRILRVCFKKPFLRIFCREHLCTQLDLSGWKNLPAVCLVQVVAKTQQQAPGSDCEMFGPAGHLHRGIIWNHCAISDLSGFYSNANIQMVHDIDFSTLLLVLESEDLTNVFSVIL